MLDEPVAVELANTWYVDGDETFDFLAPPGAIGAWTRELPRSTGFGAPGRPLTDGEAADVIALRDAVRSLIEAVVDAGSPDPTEVALVNRWVDAGRPTSARLVWSVDEAVFVAATAPETFDASALLGRLATSAVDLLTGPDARRLRRCDAPDCWMLFVRHHGRRRFCHESCGHRLRQARYERRRAEAAAPS